MSRSPDAKNTYELRVLVSDYKTLAATVRAMKVEAAKIPALEEKANEKHAQIIEALKQMDCFSSGNYGFENRVVRMLENLL